MKAKRKWILWSIAAVAALYTLFGFLVLPWALKAFAIDRLEQQLNGSISVDSIATNPYTLSLTIKQFELMDADGVSAAGFDRLYANASIASIWLGGLDLERFELTGPRLHVAIDGAGNLNLLKLLDPILNTGLETADTPVESPGTEQTGAEGAPFAVRIGLCSVSGGQLLFTDDSTAEPVRIMAAPINFELTDFHSDPEIDAPYQLTVQLDSGTTLTWEGQFSLFPLRSNARVDIAGMRPDPLMPYLDELINFAVISAEVHLAFEYNFNPLAAEPVFNIRDINLDLNNLELAESPGMPAFFKLSGLSLEGVMVDFQDARLTAERATIGSDFLRIKRLADGRIDLLDQILPRRTASTNPTPSGSLEIPEASVQEAYNQLNRTLDAFWDLQVPEITLRLEHLEFTDQTIEPAAEFRLNGIALTLRDITSKGPMPIQAQASFAMESGGRFSMEMAIPNKLDTIDAQFAVEDFALSVLSPYTSAQADLVVMDGLFSTEGRLHLPLRESSGKFGPMDLELASIEIQQPHVRVHREAAPADANAPAAGESGSGPEETNPELQAILDALHVRLGSLRIEQGQIEFEDASIEPMAYVNLGEFHMETGPFSLPATEAVPLSMQGVFKNGGSLSVEGQFVSDLQSPESAFTVRVDGMSLPPYSTYGENFVGYAIEEGALSLSTKVESEGTTFESATDVRLNRFSLSTTPSGKASLGVPIHLGLALLTDRNQQLELKNIQIYGDLADPKTRVSGLVIKALVNVFGKVATAPFALLGSLVGGNAEDLENLRFAAGSAELNDNAGAQLRSLAEALHQRPALNLIIIPGADPEADSNAYRQAAVQAQFDALAAAPEAIDWKPLRRATGIRPEMGDTALWALLCSRQAGMEALVALLQPATPPEDSAEAQSSGQTTVEPAPTTSTQSTPRRRVGKRVSSVALAQESTTASAGSTGASQSTPRLDPDQPLEIPVAAVRSQLEAAVTVPEDYLESLALRRAQNAADHLATQENIAPDRIEIADTMSDIKEPAIHFSLGAPGD